MGLDQSVMRIEVKPASPVDFKPEGEQSEVQYWRKHPNLHGWMEHLYRLKGGSAESFNCVPVELTLEDIDSLEQAIRNGELPQTSGFFFGQSTGDEADRDLQFCAEARKVLADGGFLYYDSWW